MKWRYLAVCLAVLSIVLITLATFRERLGWWPTDRFTVSQERGEVVSSADYQLSGPYTHENLTVYLVHGPETLDGRSILTLQEALEQKKVIIHETGDVNQLAIENLSRDQEIYVQSGDVVKGGQQDRTLPYDAIVGPRSGRVPIDSYCVESGRWAKRGDEESVRFASSASNTGNISSLKRASASTGGRDRGAQGAVWRSVEETQERLSKKLGESAQAEASRSSLQLTLEKSSVRAALAPYLDSLGPVVAGKDDAIGFVLAVNGKVISADVFASRALFRKLWPKLLEGSAVEAFIESGSGTPPAVSEADVRAFLTEAEGQKPTGDETTERTYVQTRQGQTTTLQESCDRSRKNLVLHRSFVRR